MNRRLETFLSILLTICTVSVAATYVYQQVSRPSSSVDPALTYIESWDRLLEGGSRVGPSSATFQIVEFGDFQCPFCRKFHFAVEELMRELAGKVSLVYYHFPLDEIHPHAVTSAQAAGCAAKDGRFAEMASQLFQKQDSIGLKPWSQYAQSAGILDTVGFKLCLQSRASEAKVYADRALGVELDVMGTPTVIINGWRFRSPPTGDSLKHYAHEVVNGRSPFPRRR